MQETTGKWVVLCSIVYDEYVSGKSNYKNFIIVPSNCEEDHYTQCSVWRKEKDANWARDHEYSSLRQKEAIRL